MLVEKMLVYTLWKKEECQFFGLCFKDFTPLIDMTIFLAENV